MTISICAGWFKPGGTSRSRRFYNYTLHPTGRYVLWDVKEIRHGVEQCESALIYTHQVKLLALFCQLLTITLFISLLFDVIQAFLSPVDCTERRNLVYNFKSLLKRDVNGHVFAGIYFAVKPIEQQRSCFSLFYKNDMGGQVDFKIGIAEVLEKGIDELTRLEHLVRCQEQLGLKNSSCGDGLARLLFQTATALADQDFMKQLLDINQRIVLLSEDN